MLHAENYFSSIVTVRNDLVDLINNRVEVPASKNTTYIVALNSPEIYFESHGSFAFRGGVY